MPTQDSQKERWFALYVRSHFEETAERCLKSKGYRAFSPSYRASRRRPDRTVELNLPLFPGYVFCCFDLHARLPILTTPGIVHIVGAGNTPESVDPAEIQSIRMAAESGRSVQPWPFLREGQKVRVEAGPLTGTEGTLLRAKDELRLVLSITLLQRSMAIVVDQDQVRPLFPG